MPGYTRESGNTLDVVGVCVNRIGMATKVHLNSLYRWSSWAIPQLHFEAIDKVNKPCFALLIDTYDFEFDLNGG